MTVDVLVQTPYPLYADNGEALIPGSGVYTVENTERIQQYIDLGQLAVAETPFVPEPVEVQAEEVVEAKPTPAKKTRGSAQKQENSDG